MSLKTVTKHAVASVADTRVGRSLSRLALRGALFAYGYNRFDDFDLSGERWLVQEFLPSLGITTAVDCGANRGDYSVMLLDSLSRDGGGLSPLIQILDRSERCVNWSSSIAIAFGSSQLRSAQQTDERRCRCTNHHNTVRSLVKYRLHSARCPGLLR